LKKGINKNMDEKIITINEIDMFDIRIPLETEKENVIIILQSETDLS